MEWLQALGARSHASPDLWCPLPSQVRFVAVVSCHPPPSQSRLVVPAPITVPACGARSHPRSDLWQLSPTPIPVPACDARSHARPVSGKVYREKLAFSERVYRSLRLNVLKSECGAAFIFVVSLLDKKVIGKIRFEATERVIHDFSPPNILTLERLGGEVVSPPPDVFLRCTPNYEADRAEILHSLWGILCATFGKKILTGSCQVTEL